MTNSLLLNMALVVMYHSYYPLVMTNIAMENGPFIDDFPIKTTIYTGFSMAMLNNQMVYSMAIKTVDFSMKNIE